MKIKYPDKYETFCSLYIPGLCVQKTVTARAFVKTKPDKQVCIIFYIIFQVNFSAGAFVPFFHNLFNSRMSLQTDPKVRVLIR